MKIILSTAIYFLVISQTSFAFVINGLEDKKNTFDFVLRLENHCSSVAVDKNKILTNWHCVRDLCGKRHINAVSEKVDEIVDSLVEIFNRDEDLFFEEVPLLYGTTILGEQDLRLKLYLIFSQTSQAQIKFEGKSFPLKHVICKRDSMNLFQITVNDLISLYADGELGLIDAQKRYEQYFLKFDVTRFNEQNPEMAFPYFLTENNMKMTTEDLAVVHLEKDHGFPTIEISTVKPQPLAPIIAVGYGQNSTYNLFGIKSVFPGGSGVRRYGANYLQYNKETGMPYFSGEPKNDFWSYRLKGEGNGVLVSLAPGDSGGAILNENAELFCISQSIEETSSSDQKSYCTPLYTESNIEFLRMNGLIK